MKKIINLFLLILFNVLFLVGCQDIDSLQNGFINDTGIDKLLTAITEADTEEAAEADENNEADINDEHITDYDTYEDDSETADISNIEDETEYNIEDDSSLIIDEPATYNEAEETDINNGITVYENENYSDKDRVALYLHTYGKLPGNYITKKEAQKLGWDNRSNTMAEVLPGMSIGGDNFGNYEGILPKAQGRTYKECDIDYEKGGRNAKRIVYSNDGLIFYTDDHYNTFEQLYPNE